MEDQKSLASSEHKVIPKHPVAVEDDGQPGNKKLQRKHESGHSGQPSSRVLTTLARPPQVYSKCESTTKRLHLTPASSSAAGTSLAHCPEDTPSFVNRLKLPIKFGPSIWVSRSLYDYHSYLRSSWCSTLPVCKELSLPGHGQNRMHSQIPPSLR
ncbi:hypothetical protein FRB91_006908 [Serendipita sp. 411]|nr:hypothetical protein FRB91_006908 [Serendipita sp. 411]